MALVRGASCKLEKLRDPDLMAVPCRVEWVVAASGGELRVELAGT